MVPISLTQGQPLIASPDKAPGVPACSPRPLTQRRLHAGAQAARVALVLGQSLLRGSHGDWPLVLAARPLPQLLGTGGCRQYVLIALHDGEVSKAPTVGGSSVQSCTCQLHA